MNYFITLIKLLTLNIDSLIYLFFKRMKKLSNIYYIDDVQLYFISKKHYQINFISNNHQR